MNAKDLKEFHSLVEQFQSDMSLKDICSQVWVDYRSCLSWRKRNGPRSRKATAPSTMVEVERLIEFLDRIKPVLCLN